jgi:hypothetical protein
MEAESRARSESETKASREPRGEKTKRETASGDQIAAARVFDEISFRENFAKLATKRFSCFAKMRDEFCEFRDFAKLPILQKKRV